MRRVGHEECPLAETVVVGGSQARGSEGMRNADCGLREEVGCVDVRLA